MDCAASQIYAARYAEDLFASQEHLDIYLDRWSRVTAREPVLSGRIPQRYRGTTARITIFTRNQQVIDALRNLETTTGDAKFDAITSALQINSVHPYAPMDTTGEYNFEFTVDRLYFNEEVLAARLSETNTRLVPPLEQARDDGKWMWLGDGNDLTQQTAQIDFRIGWHDCGPGCGFFHDLRAVVPPVGDAVVYDMGGDPLPPELALSPETLPPPE